MSVQLNKNLFSGTNGKKEQMDIHRPSATTAVASLGCGDNTKRSVASHDGGMISEYKGDYDKVTMLNVAMNEALRRHKEKKGCGLETHKLLAIRAKIARKLDVRVTTAHYLDMMKDKKCAQEDLLLLGNTTEVEKTIRFQEKDDVFEFHPHTFNNELFGDENHRQRDKDIGDEEHCEPPTKKKFKLDTDDAEDLATKQGYLITLQANSTEKPSSEPHHHEEEEEEESFIPGYTCW